MNPEQSKKEEKVPIRPRQREARAVSRPNMHNPLGKQFRKKEESTVAGEGHLMALLATALKKVVESGEEIGKPEAAEEKKGVFVEKKPPKLRQLAKAVGKPLTSERLPEEKEDTFWGRVRALIAEAEMLYPIRFWGAVLFFVGCFVTLLVLGMMLLFQRQLDGEMETSRERVVGEEKASAPLEATVAAINKLLETGGEKEARKRLEETDQPVPGARYLLAISDYRKGNGLQARAALEQAPVKGNASRSSEQALLAWTAFVGKPSEFLLPQAKSDERALEHIRAALGSDPTNVFAWRLLALWQRRNGQEKEAVKTLEAARLLAEASGQRLEVEMQLAVARVGAMESATEEIAAPLPQSRAGKIARQAALEARWEEREKAVEALRQLTNMVGLPETITLLEDPVFQALTLTPEETLGLVKEKEIP